jgi:hypothetical protein
MTWEIEASDEFGIWYRGLDEDEIESVNFSVDLLGQTGPILGRPTWIHSMDLRFRISRNCGFNMRAGLCASCSFSIRDASAT